MQFYIDNLPINGHNISDLFYIYTGSDTLAIDSVAYGAGVVLKVSIGSARLD
jgi:hypothetical protein